MKKKVLFFRFQHETNAICPAPADMTAYKIAVLMVGDEIMQIPRVPGRDVPGVLEVFDHYDDIQIIPVVNMYANPSGPVTKDVYRFVEDHLRSAIAKHTAFDGVMILFHGAMVAECHPDAEGDLLQLLRELLGWEIPIVASLDLHANVTEKMAHCATALVSYRQYPHVDVYDTAVEAAQLLADTIHGKCKPVMAYRRIPHLLPLFPTEKPQIRPLYDLAAACQQHSRALAVTFTHGFFAADIDELGMAVLAVTDNDPALAESIADELAAAINRDKDDLYETYLSLDEALDLALEPGNGPVVIADTSDNPGGGGLGNTTWILRRILERKLTGCALAVIVDPASVLLCEQSGVGNMAELKLGGWSDPVYSGGPLEVTAYVRAITDGNYVNRGRMGHGGTMKMGKTAVLEIAGNIVLVTSIPTQPYDLEVFPSHGINPKDMRLLVVKSSIHYRATFGTIARAMHPVPVPGYIDPRPQTFPFRTWKGTI